MNTSQLPIKIGTVILDYSETGIPLQASFNPAAVKLDEDFLDELRHTTSGNQTGEDIQHGADLVMSHFFSQVNDIELSDRTKYKITSTVQKCTQYENGLTHTCIIDYQLELLPDPQLN